MAIGSHIPERPLALCSEDGVRVPNASDEMDGPVTARTRDHASHPQEQGAWNLAVIAYDHIDGTDVEQALMGMEADELVERLRKEME